MLSQPVYGGLEWSVVTGEPSDLRGYGLPPDYVDPSAPETPASEELVDQALASFTAALAAVPEPYYASGNGL